MNRSAAILAILLGAAGARAADPLPTPDRLQLADGLFARQMHDLAAAEYEAVLKAFPTNANADAATYRLGECYRALKRHADADKLFKRVVATYPDSPYRFRAGFRRADIHLETGNAKAAMMLYQELLAAKPPPDIAPAGLFFLADAARESGDLTAAEAALQRILQEYPTSDYYAYALLKLGELRSSASLSSPGDDVLAMYAQALTNAPSDRVAAEALFQLGEAHFARSDFTQSADCYRRLLAGYPQDERAPRARLRGAWACHNAGLYADALRLTEETLAAAPAADTQEDWLYLKANCLRQLLRDGDALSAYAAVEAAFPNGRLVNAARLERALTLYRMGRFADTVALAKTLPPSLDNRKDIYWLLAESFAALKQDDDAVQYYRLIATEFPTSDVAADATYRLAYHLQQRGDTSEAARFFETVVANFPDHKLAPQALLAAGFCQAGAGKDAEAVQLWAQLIARYPQDPLTEDARYRKALAEIRLRRPENARQTLSELLKRAPDSTLATDAHFWQGVLLREAGDLPAAEQALRAALAAKPRAELARESELQLALLLHQRGAYAEAADLLRPLLESPVRTDLTPTLLQWLAEFEFTRARHDDSAAAAKVLVELAIGPAGKQIGWALLGRARAAQNRPTEAAEAFRQALACDARTALGAEAALRLGDLDLAATNNAAAVTRYELAAQLAGDESLAGLRARAYAGLGRAAQARRDAAAAARYFMSVAILYDDAELVPESLCAAAQALHELGRTEDARKTIDELRQRYPASPWVSRAESILKDAPAQPAAPPS